MYKRILVAIENSNADRAVLEHIESLARLTGPNNANLALGVSNGSPVVGATMYDGNNDLEWWYTSAATALDPNRVPKTQIPASIAAWAIGRS